MFGYVLDWEALKEWLAAELQLSHALLHVHLGLALFLLAALALRRPPGSPLPLLVVAVLEAANEGVDYLRYSWSGWPWRPEPTIEDIVNTLLWPALLTAGAWLRERRARGTGSAAPAGAAHRA